MTAILAVWTVCLFLGPPIWLTMALAGTAFIFLQHIDPIIIAQQEVSAANSFTFVAAPLFILMGQVMKEMQGKADARVVTQLLEERLA